MKAIALFLSLMLLLSCGSSRSTHTGTEACFTRIEFYESGGFTGQNLRYYLDKEAGLYKIMPAAAAEKIKVIEDTALKRIDSLACNLLRIGSNGTASAGNINRGLRIETTDTTRSFHWSKPGEDPAPELVRLYRELMKLP